jgi:TatD DNase family protein
MIDSHCHLADEAFVPDLPAMLARAGDAGITTALCIVDAGSQGERIRARAVRELWPAVRFAVGVHPHLADTYRADPNGVVQAIARALDSVDGVCAIGEMGLDYHYDYAPRPLQQKVFAAQVHLARTRGLPIVIHTREADADTLQVLRDAGQGAVRGVFHCFTGDAPFAKAAVDLGFHVSFSGIVTFPNAGPLREVAAAIPDDRILIETDSPYLAPVPHRSKRNEPAFVGKVAEALAAARRTTPAIIVQQTTANFEALFGKS